MFGFKIVQVEEQSMEPVLRKNDLILIKTHFNMSSLKRNSLIILRSPIEKNLMLAKRVVGIPNDFVQIYSNNEVVLNLKDQSSSDSSLKNDWIEYDWNLGKDDFIVLSDNKLIRTQDSRLFGPIKFSNIIGIVIFKLKPFSRIK